jgi:hypothetical protein
MSAVIQEELYLGDRYATREALEAEIDFWDATTAGWYAWCPRVAQYSHRMGLSRSEEALPLVTGNAGHAGLNVLYTSDDEELALQTVVETFGERDAPPPSHAYAHLHSGFVEAVFKNYLVWRRSHDVFKPLVLHLDELDLRDVIAAVWRVLPDGKVILGESKLVMRFTIGGEEFIYAGKPDLPIVMGGRVNIMDHKWSCGGYLSDWWAEKYIIANQLRGYCKMIGNLIQQQVLGAYINGIYAGEKALETRTAKGAPSKVTKFARFGPWVFRPSHLDEAIWNQFAWRKMAFVFQELAAQYPIEYRAYGYPQNTGKSCQGCQFLEVCQEQPKGRAGLLQRKYVQRQRQFLDL